MQRKYISCLQLFQPIIFLQAEKLPEVAPEPVNIATNNAKAAKKVENDIMSVLLQHEKQSGNGSGT